MRDKSTTALVLGASGMIGSQVVRHLLDHPAYERIYIVSRRDLSIDHPKIFQIIADFDNIDSFVVNLRIDHLFCCLGTTNSKTPDRKAYYQVDHDYPIKVAKILKSNHCKSICLVSSMGANPSASNFYLRMKGETERDLIQLGFETTCIFRPSLLVGNRSEFRFLEKSFSVIFKIINPILLGPLKDYRSIKGETVAKAMINAAQIESAGIHYYQTNQIKKLA